MGGDEETHRHGESGEYGHTEGHEHDRPYLEKTKEHKEAWYEHTFAKIRDVQKELR